jgi:hypothetical protein
VNLLLPAAQPASGDHHAPLAAIERDQAGFDEEQGIDRPRHGEDEEQHARFVAPNEKGQRKRGENDGGKRRKQDVAAGLRFENEPVSGRGRWGHRGLSLASDVS